MANSFQTLLKSGRPAIGSWIAFADPYSVELMADVGFDWLLIDTEHVPIDRHTLRTILVSMKGSVSAPVVVRRAIRKITFKRRLTWERKPWLFQ